MARSKIQKGDKVKVISGKDKGKTGTVTRVIRESGKLIVEGINIMKKHQKEKIGDKPTGIISFEAPLFASKVMLIDPKNNKPTRVSFTVKDGKKMRITKKSKSTI